MEQIRLLSDEALGAMATAEAGTFPDDVLLAIWEELAARGLIVDDPDRTEGLAGGPPPEGLVTVATYSDHFQAQFAQNHLLTCGIQAYLSDDNVIRLDWFLSAALGGIRLRVPDTEAAEARAILQAAEDGAEGVG